MIVYELKGCPFTRSKYGQQTWKKVIEKVCYERCEIDGRPGVRCIVVAQDGSEYYLDEIALL